MEDARTSAMRRRHLKTRALLSKAIVIELGGIPSTVVTNWDWHPQRATLLPTPSFPSISLSLSLSLVIKLSRDFPVNFLRFAPFRPSSRLRVADFDVRLLARAAVKPANDH